MATQKDVKIGIVIPCYNEQEVIRFTVTTVMKLMDNFVSEGVISQDSFIGLVDDRSADKTWEEIRSLTLGDNRVKAIRLSSNRGHQHALLAGLLEFNQMADCLITIDADLQDDIEVIGEMIEKFKQGNQIVFGVRKNRDSDSFIKRGVANTFYRILCSFNEKIIFNHADFRLTSKRVIEEFSNYSEVNIFLRGLFSSIGFDTAIVYYNRKMRNAGVSKYKVGKMLSLAFDGITSFSIVPLRIITITGFLVFIICIMLLIYAVVGYFQQKAIPGWFSTVLPYYFLGGIQILCIGIIGEYLGKIYKEVKRRPRYIIDERIG